MLWDGNEIIGLFTIGQEGVKDCKTKLSNKLRICTDGLASHVGIIINKVKKRLLIYKVDGKNLSIKELTWQQIALYENS